MGPWELFGWVAAVSCSVLVAGLTVVVVIAAAQGLRQRQKDMTTVVMGRKQ